MESSRHIRNKNVIKHKIYKNLIKQSFLFVVIEIIGNVITDTEHQVKVAYN